MRECERREGGLERTENCTSHQQPLTTTLTVGGVHTRGRPLEKSSSFKDGEIEVFSFSTMSFSSRTRSESNN